VGEEPSDLQAAGVSVITGAADIANVRLSFPGGCVANVTASRISLSSMRKMRIFQPQAYLSLDLHEGKRELIRLRGSGEQLSDGELQVLQVEGRVVTRKESRGERDALALEIDAFLRAVRARAAGEESGPPHGVSGEEAASALRLAERITREIGTG
jgi:predicted dehydrogenase